jgi:hypothetical protein
MQSWLLWLRLLQRSCFYCTRIEGDRYGCKCGIESYPRVDYQDLLWGYGKAKKYCNYPDEVASLCREFTPEITNKCDYCGVTINKPTYQIAHLEIDDGWGGLSYTCSQECHSKLETEYRDEWYRLEALSKGEN